MMCKVPKYSAKLQKLMSKACWFFGFLYHKNKIAMRNWFTDHKQKLIHGSRIFLKSVWPTSIPRGGSKTFHFLQLYGHHQYKAVRVLWKAVSVVDSTHVTLVYQLSPTGNSCKKVKSYSFFSSLLPFPTQEQGWIATNPRANCCKFLMEIWSTFDILSSFPLVSSHCNNISITLLQSSNPRPQPAACCNAASEAD